MPYCRCTKRGTIAHSCTRYNATSVANKQQKNTLTQTQTQINTNTQINGFDGDTSAFWVARLFMRNEWRDQRGVAEDGTIVDSQHAGYIAMLFKLTTTTTGNQQRELTHSLTHCCAWLAKAVATSTTSDPAPMTTASRLCTRDPLPPVASRSSLAGQVDASSRGQGICPARGWHSAGGCCGLVPLWW